MFDRAHFGTGIRGPEVLRHYTSWAAAESILTSQRFRATAHDCTNDPEELVYVDQTILEMVAAELVESSGVMRAALQRFIDGYPSSRVGQSGRTYLVCFSTERDMRAQWLRYGDRGRGVSVGLRLLKTPEPALPKMTTAIMPVTYGRADLRRKFGAFHAALKELAAFAVDCEANAAITREALARTADGWAISSKAPSWESEHEVRMIFWVREGEVVEPTTVTRTDGTLNRFVLVPVTDPARLKRMPVVELMLGPNRAPEDRGRAIELLGSLGYPNPERRVVESSELPILDFETA